MLYPIIINETTMRIIIFFLAVLFIGCKEEQLKPLEGGGKAPGPVSNVQVLNLPGKVTLTYSLPGDAELLYVKAVYEIRKGKQMEMISTFYNTTLTMDGFADTEEREVKLYAVSRTEVASAPVTVKVKPLTPPIEKTFASLSFEADFGGITSHFVNDDSANIVIGVLTKDERGAVIPADMFYTSQKIGEFSTRGFDDQERWFGLYVRDRWGNHSDTVGKIVKPFAEIQLDKKLFKPYKLPTDATFFGNHPMSNLWNNIVAGGSSSSNTWLRTANGSGIPHWYTFDLGVNAKLSRFNFIPRGATDEQNLIYSAGDPHLFEMWGSSNPTPDGSYSSWVKLMSCETVKPSGLPIGTNSNDDIEKAKAGHEFKFPLDAPPVRYIRIKMLQTWGNSDYFWMAEMTIFGQLQ
jgi:hypothetical protein